jgi:uncharacterized repeat protein (TIGR03803 family)
MGRLKWGMTVCGVFLLWVGGVALFAQTTANAPPAQTATSVPPVQTFATLYNFCSQGGNQCTDGENPYAGLVQGTDGNLYGAAVGDGKHKSACSFGCGVVFRITTDGGLTILHRFVGTDGFGPYGGLIEGTDGKFYGTTFEGGVHDDGTVFSITAGGELTTLHSFDYTDGTMPYAGVVQGANGKFYGTTEGGGAYGEGAVFSMASDGKLKTLISFGFTDGYQPFADLVQSTNGKFYGTTSGGGANGDIGTVFSITGIGTLKTVFSFNGRNGAAPSAGLIQATGGNFYGTTYGGGKTCRHKNICGTIFKITPDGKLTTLYSFCAAGYPCLDGSGPSGALVEGTDGNFYGTTSYGGQNNVCTTQHPGCGTVFKITPDGTLTTLYNFSGADGANPIGALIQDTNGTFYGTTFIGGTYNRGTIFSLSLGLVPFIETRPTSGTVGTAVTILGTDLTGVTNVRFNGLESKFTIVSASEITTTVPKGATTGPVRVITPTGKLQSNVPFRVD